MKKVLLIALAIGVLLCLCGCQSSASAATAVPATKSLSQMTDYELLCIMAEKQVVHNWALSSYREYADPVEDLASRSPEFSELMSRDTAVDSIKTYADQIDEAYPLAMINFIVPFFS